MLLIKRSLVAVACLAASFSVVAQTKTDGQKSEAAPKQQSFSSASRLPMLDISGYLGYASQDMDAAGERMGGYNLGARAMYHLGMWSTRMGGGTFVPVVGGGLKYSKTKKEISGVDFAFNYLALEVNGGVKFADLAPSMDFYGLLNFGYGFDSEMEASVAGLSAKSDVDSHMYYGVTAGATYNFTSAMGAGLELGWNHHTGDNDFKSDEMLVSVVGTYHL